MTSLFVCISIGKEKPECMVAPTISSLSSTLSEISNDPSLRIFTSADDNIRKSVLSLISMNIIFYLAYIEFSLLYLSKKKLSLFILSFSSVILSA